MIKYKTDLINALKKAGYNTNYIRKNKLLSESTMTKLRNNDTTITLNNVDVICNLLSCQPGDIIEHIPDSGEHSDK